MSLNGSRSIVAREQIWIPSNRLTLFPKLLTIESRGELNNLNGSFVELHGIGKTIGVNQAGGAVLFDMDEMLTTSASGHFPWTTTADQGDVYDIPQHILQQEVIRDAVDRALAKLMVVAKWIDNGCKGLCPIQGCNFTRNHIKSLFKIFREGNSPNADATTCSMVTQIRTCANSRIMITTPEELICMQIYLSQLKFGSDIDQALLSLRRVGASQKEEAGTLQSMDHILGVFTRNR